MKSSQWCPVSLFILCGIFTFSSSSAQSADNLINTTSLLSGSFMSKTPESYAATNLLSGSIMDYAPEALFDQSPKVWCSKEKARFPHVFQIELTEDFIISSLEFDNQCENYPGISTRDVLIEFSMSVANPVFVEVQKYTLLENKINTFSIEPQPARVIRLTILSNYGNKEYTELAEFKAMGESKTKSVNTIDIHGKWDSNWGSVEFIQNATLIDGRYDYNDGQIRYGGINRNQITYRWVERKMSQEGQTIMFLNQEGTRLTGIWCHGNDWNNYGFWILHRKKGLPMTPFKEEPAAAPPVIQNEIVQELKKDLKTTHKLVLYGINFRNNSAEILPESFPVLKQIAEILVEEPGMRISIEGHTDGVGSDSYNEKLSSDRANSVKEYFVKNQSIDFNRLMANGKGEKFPIADNTTEIGRAANRRVEIHLLE